MTLQAHSGSRCRCRVGAGLVVTRSEFYPVNVIKAESIRKGERVCKRLSLGKEEGERRGR